VPYRVIQWATGAVGSNQLREVIQNPDFELVGLYVYSEEKEGKDAGVIVGLDPVGITATRDRDRILPSMQTWCSTPRSPPRWRPSTMT
jgi:4-hydroxy-tetrahydrodipicolinate reductase